MFRIGGGPRHPRGDSVGFPDPAEGVVIPVPVPSLGHARGFFLKAFLAAEALLRMEIRALVAMEDPE